MATARNRLTHLESCQARTRRGALARYARSLKATYRQELERLGQRIANRYDVLARYARSLKATYRQELERLKKPLTISPG